MNSSQSVLDSLSKLSYIIINSVEVEGKVKYLKAYNSKGIGVYIYVDMENVVALSVDGKFIVKQYHGSSSLIPSSHINTIDKIPQASGLVYECQNELCAVIRNNDRTIQTPVFRVEEPFSSSPQIFLEGEILGYPLLRYTEILASPEDALSRSIEVYEFIKRRELSLAELEIEQFLKAIDHLYKVSEKLTNQGIRLSDKIQEQIKLFVNYEPIKPNKETIALNVFLREQFDRRILALQKNAYQTHALLQQIINSYEINMRELENIDLKLGESNDPSILSLEDVDKPL